MPLINRCGGGGAKINGIVESYLVAAGENISAGDFVSFVNEEASEIVKNKVQSPSAGTASVFESASTYYISATVLSQTNVLVAYQDSGNSSYGTAVVLTISGTTITVGTPIVFDTVFTTSVSAAVLSQTSVAVAYRKGDGTNYGKAVVLTISGTTITAGTPVAFSSANAQYISALALSQTKVLVAYNDVGNSNYGTAVILTISGTTITVGTAVVFESASSQYISAVVLSATGVLVAYYDGGNSGYGTAVVLTISGTTITVGTPIVFESASSQFMSAVAISAKSVFIAYRDVGNSNYGTAIVLYVPQMLNIVGVAKESGSSGDTIDVYTPTVPVLPAEEVDLSPYILNLLGTLTFSGTYATSTYYTAADCTWACNSKGEIVIIIRGGTSTSYENVIFTLASAPTGVDLKTGSSSWGATNPAQQHYGCVLTGVTAKVNIAINLSAVNSTYDYVQCDLTVTAA